MSEWSGLNGRGGVRVAVMGAGLVLAGGGVVMTQFIHQLDLACHIFGEPAQVHAQIDTFDAAIESEDTATVSVRFRCGAVASFAATLCGHAPPTQSWHIFGTRGSAHNPWAVYTDDAAQLTRDLDQLQQLYPPLSPPPRQPSMHLVARAWRKGLRVLRLGGQVVPARPTLLHVPYYTAVLDALDAGQPLPISAEQAMQSLELTTAIYISGLTGEPVDLPLNRDNPYVAGISADDYRGHRDRAAHAVTDPHLQNESNHAHHHIAAEEQSRTHRDRPVGITR